MDEIYVLARRVLLDALEALGPHREAVVLVGAQAVYLRVGEGDLAVAPYTTDGDLAINPGLLGARPPLEQALGQAGFFPKSDDSVGIWVTVRQTRQHPHAEIPIDLLVPALLSPGKGRRSAQLPGHDRRAARIVSGLEGVMVDADTLALTSLEETDPRTVSVRVAGPAALLVAKAYKIQERVSTVRLVDKDALDVLRLLRGTSTDELRVRFANLLGNPMTQEITQKAFVLLEELFARRQAEGVKMILRATEGLADPKEMEESCVSLTADLISAVGGR